MNLFCVVYRTGGTANFKWNRSTVYYKVADARESAADCRRQGYHCFVADYKRSLEVGLPETFDESGVIQ